MSHFLSLITKFCLKMRQSAGLMRSRHLSPLRKLALLMATLIALSTPLSSYAQDEADAYDPFIDYNEFEIADEEEADINFFRHGRFVTMGFLLGYRSFTEGMGQIYGDDVAYGGYLSYFFDLRFALQFGYTTSSHSIAVGGVRGDTKIGALSIDLKYYLNTQNVTKGLATLNPYFVGGFSSFNRQSTVDGQPEFSKDSAMGVNMGMGIEIPFLNNKMYFGAQGMYQLVNFRDENSEIVLDEGQNRTGRYPNGDILSGMLILGVNF
jgi:hypothetical protein